MYFADLDPKTAAMLDAASADGLLPLLREMICDERDLDPHVFVVKHDGLHQFGVVVLGITKQGEEVVREVELSVAWSAISERARAAVALVWLDQIRAANRARVKKLNARLAKRGLPPIVLPPS